MTPARWRLVAVGVAGLVAGAAGLFALQRLGHRRHPGPAARAKAGSEQGERHPAYREWLGTVPVPLYEGLRVDDVAEVKVRPWPDYGANGALIHFAGYGLAEAMVWEIPPRSRARRHRHLYEEYVLVLRGGGHTVFEQEGRAPQRVEWQPFSYFAVPLNAWHEHVNDGDQPVRLLAFTSAPFLVNALGGRDPLYRSDLVFRDRYDGEPDYFRRDTLVEHWLSTQDERPHRDSQVHGVNFIRDVSAYPGNRRELIMGGNTVNISHLLTLAVGRYREAHIHGGEVMFYVLAGTGYFLAWQEGKFDERIRIDFRPGTLFGIPPGRWYHHSLNTGKERARLLSFRAARGVFWQGGMSDLPREAEPPQILEEYAAALERAGIPLKMKRPAPSEDDEE